ncbi:MAG: hypothetical protein ACE15F_22135 [bacterium]
MGKILIHTRKTAGLVDAALRYPGDNATCRLVDRILAAAASESIRISFILFRVAGLAAPIAMPGERRARKIVKALLDILLGQTPDNVFVDCSGANEFLFVLPGVEKDEAWKAGEAIRARFHQASRPLLKNEASQLDLCGAVAAFPEDAQDRFELFRTLRETLFRIHLNGASPIVRAFPVITREYPTRLTELQIERLQQWATRDGVSEDSLVKEAVDDLLMKYAR